MILASVEVTGYAPINPEVSLQSTLRLTMFSVKSGTVNISRLGTSHSFSVAVTLPLQGSAKKKKKQSLVMQMLMNVVFFC